MYVLIKRNHAQKISWNQLFNDQSFSKEVTKYLVDLTGKKFSK